MYFRTYAIRNTWLVNWQKCPISENPLKRNMINGPKNCSKLNDSTFTIFIDSCEDNYPCKSLSKCYAKS